MSGALTSKQREALVVLADAYPFDVACGPHTADGQVNAVTAKVLIRRGLAVQVSRRPVRYKATADGLRASLGDLTAPPRGGVA